MRYDEITYAIKTAPATWIPGILVAVIEAAAEKKVFRDGGLQSFVKSRAKGNTTPDSGTTETAGLGRND